MGCADKVQSTNDFYANAISGLDPPSVSAYCNSLVTCLRDHLTIEENPALNNKETTHGFEEGREEVT